jgi:putative DNA primase/helicase
MCSASRRWIASTPTLQQGQRHKLALALSGTLLNGRLHGKDARRLFQALIAAANDTEFEDRLKCLSDTAEKLKAGQPVRGRNELAEIIGAKATDRVCEWLGIVPYRNSVSVGQTVGLPVAYGGAVPESDIANAERFTARNRGRARYSYLVKKWFIWDGCRWTIDADGEIYRLASDTVREMAKEAVDSGDKYALAWAAKSHNLQRITNMIGLAQSHCSVRLEDFDADPWKLNCQSGIIDLKTAELLPHDPDEMMRKSAPVDFDLQSECPTFLAFLNRILHGDGDLIEFVQRAIGYSLTGNTGEQCLFVLVGNGANGKSTLIKVIQDLLGDYAQTTPMDTLMTQRSGAIPNDIARLEGARLVSAAEAEAGQRLAEAKIKLLTGGDRISARYLNAEFFEFIPQFKLWLATNKLPEVRGTDDGIWRRFKVVRFNETIPEAERDPTLSDKLKAELPGILNWAIKGCLDWHRNGLKPPAKVTDATRAYRAEMDVVAQFIEDRCVTDRQADVTVKALYDNYVEWCQANGETAISKRSFGQRLTEQGFKQRPTRDARKWQGIRLKTEAELLRIEEPEPPKRFYEAANDDGCQPQTDLANVACEQ